MGYTQNQNQGRGQTRPRWQIDSEKARARDAATPQATRRRTADANADAHALTQAAGARRGTSDSMRGILNFSDFILSDLVRLISAFEPDELNSIRLEDEFSTEDKPNPCTFGMATISVMISFHGS